VSLIWMARWLVVTGRGRLARPAELALHLLSAVGVYLGRVVRLNSWDAFTDPVQVLTEALDVLEERRTLVFIAAFAVVLWVLYEAVRFVTVAVFEKWQRRSPDYQWSRHHHRHHHHHG
jgi:uncharacterized membrane protein